MNATTSTAQYQYPAYLEDEKRVVRHPYLRGSFALYDVYGDYVIDHRGYVQAFTESAARAALGKLGKP